MDVEHELYYLLAHDLKKKGVVEIKGFGKFVVKVSKKGKKSITFISSVQLKDYIND